MLKDSEEKPIRKDMFQKDTLNGTDLKCLCRKVFRFFLFHSKTEKIPGTNLKFVILFFPETSKE